MKRALQTGLPVRIEALRRPERKEL